MCKINPSKISIILSKKACMINMVVIILTICYFYGQAQSLTQTQVGVTDTSGNCHSYTKRAALKNEVSCKRDQCAIWMRISLSKQRMYFYLNGQLSDTFKISTGNSKHPTPLMDRRPSGPMFLKYTSKKFPGGNYMGLGNMPYVVFIRGGYAIHGTTKGNINFLGKRVSHGCIRLHPANGKIVYEHIKQVGIENTWVTIEN